MSTHLFHVDENRLFVECKNRKKEIGKSKRKESDRSERVGREKRRGETTQVWRPQVITVLLWLRPHTYTRTHACDTHRQAGRQAETNRQTLRIRHMNSLCEVDDVIAFFGLLRGCHDSAAVRCCCCCCSLVLLQNVCGMQHEMCHETAGSSQNEAKCSSPPRQDCLTTYLLDCGTERSGERDVGCGLCLASAGCYFSGAACVSASLLVGWLLDIIWKVIGGCC